MTLKNINILRFYYEYKTNKNKEKRLFYEFYKDLEKFNSMAREEQQAKNEYLYPCLYDKTNSTEIEPIYFFQDAWAFEKIYQNNPSRHIDIGSHHKFVAFLSKIIDTTMVDIRPLSVDMPSIKFLKGSILKLPFEDNQIDSLSSMCVIEHIGLGRYGDDIDPFGSEKAIKEISRVLKPKGDFYFSVPIEETNKIYFNAHRAFNEAYLLNELLTNYELVCKRYIYGAEFLDYKKSGFGIGCYHLKKA
jgi:SAM-dependent methyltransferase